MTLREPLTRYTITLTGMVGEGSELKIDAHPESNGHFVKFADVEARDQAREAEIRELIAKWRDDVLAPAMTNSAASWLELCADELESLLTPSPEETKERTR